MLGFTLILHSILIPVASAKPVDWHGLCLEMRSGNALPAPAQKALKDSLLDQKLETALKAPNELRDAACVVAHAKREKLLPSLLAIPNHQLVPEVFQALVRIRTDQNEKQIQEKMIAWMGQADREDSILKTLGALQVLEDLNWTPDPKALRGLLDSGVPEVRVRGYDYLLNRFDRLSSKDQAELIIDALKKDPLQVRVSALRTYKRLTDAQKKILKIDLKDCRKDEAEEVREECP